MQAVLGSIARGWIAVALVGTAALAGACDTGSATSGGGTGGSPGAGGAPGGGGGDTGSRVVADGYLTAGPWAGAGFTATDPGAATITPDCGGSSGCVPAFSGDTFCMRGTVTGRADYTGFAMLGWNVNQPAGGGDPQTWAVPATGGVTVTVANNPPSTQLRVQLQGTNPHDGSDRWCVALANGQFTPWTAFKTNCWTGGSPQNALTAGTPIQQGAILVPGLQTALPFDVCLVDVQITP